MTLQIHAVGLEHLTVDTGTYIPVPTVQLQHKYRGTKAVIVPVVCLLSAGIGIVYKYILHTCITCTYGVRTAYTGRRLQ